MGQIKKKRNGQRGKLKKGRGGQIRKKWTKWQI